MPCARRRPRLHFSSRVRVRVRVRVAVESVPYRRYRLSEIRTVRRSLSTRRARAAPAAHLSARRHVHVRTCSSSSCVEAVRRYRAYNYSTFCTLPSAARRGSGHFRFWGESCHSLYADRSSRVTCGQRAAGPAPHIGGQTGSCRVHVMALFSLHERATTYACMLVLPTPAALAVATHRRALPLLNGL